MTFPININIPAAKNTPAQDQPEMQKNYANIAGFLAVDHTAPGSFDAGTHTHVTFPNKVVPIPVSGEYVPSLFTNNQDGATTPNILPNDQLFFFSGSLQESLQQYIIQNSDLSNGSTMLFGGIILKWAIVTGNNTPISFTSLGIGDFPNHVFCASATPKSGGGNQCVITNLTKTSISVGASGSAPCYVIIIGN